MIGWAEFNVGRKTEYKGKRILIKLHIGGKIPKDGWTILDIQAASYVDLVGSCMNMPFLEDGSVDQIYASHVFEHLGHREELFGALSECHRVLRTDGKLMMSVPDLKKLAALFVSSDISLNQRYEIMLSLFGGQLSPHDFHKSGFFEELLVKYLNATNFSNTEIVEEFDLFEDSSKLRIKGQVISLNVIATK